MSGIGDALLDLGWWLFADRALTEGSGCTRLPGLPSREQTVARWERATGRPAGALAYDELFAGLRFTVVMLRLGQLLADIGLVPPEFAYDNLVSQALTADSRVLSDAPGGPADPGIASRGCAAGDVASLRVIEQCARSR
jgi:hypothetical protein